MLTDSQCRSAKCKDKPYKLTDANGLYLEVKPNGVKAWRYRFKLTKAGETKETPTLEMGIDIGDLSTVLLCSVPPAQANYLQRIGRAGRRDGNALALTIAGGHRHDLYFYTAPLEMLAGAVSTPGVFLKAMAVLERQMLAFCFDRWVATGVDGSALPGLMREVLDAVEADKAGGFGNLIALPLQKVPRENGSSVFVDDALRPYPDQWAFLASVQPMATHDIEPTILRATGGSHPLDVTFIDEEDQQEPWKRTLPARQRLPGPMPASLTVTLANLLYFDKAQLPQALANRLIRLAAFQNPEFYKAQAMRLPVWDEPRVIGCAENFPNHIALPRGCLDAAQELLRENGIHYELRDERFGGDSLDVSFAGTLRPDQKVAVSAMLRHDTGILCAPTAFGKTVTAAAVIARRGVNTLVLVHRTELLKQWQERLQAFLGVGKGVIGTIGGGKAKPTGKIDIAVMQSLSRQGVASELVENYGQVIVDECHHLSAFSFEAILKRTLARYVLGLTATPIRRDGRQPIIFMQCGPIRHTASKPAGAPQTLEVIPRYLAARIDLPVDAAIQDIFRHVANDLGRTAAIASEVANAFEQGHKVLVLTERTEHLDAIGAALGDRIQPLFTLHGRMSKKQRAALISELDALPADAPRVLLSTGKLVGEGFDHPPLDTLVLAMPISWKGTLQQYAGRLHREHADKTRVRIIDFVDAGHPALSRMWERRKRGYQTMGYRIPPTGISDNPDFEMRLSGEAGIGPRVSGQQVAFKLHLR